MANTLAYGFVGLANLFAERVDDDNIQTVRDAIAQSTAEHNRQVNGIMAEFVEKTEAYSARFKLSGSGTMQPLDEYGNPLPVREAGFYDVAFPIQGAGTAFGDNRITRALMTVEEVNEYTLNTLRRDADWMKRHMLAALFDDTTWTYPDADKGDLTIQPLANGDTVTHIKNNGNSETDDHFLATASAIDNTNSPYAGIFTDLMEHPSNQGGIVVCYVPTALKQATLDLTAFVDVSQADIRQGNDTAVLSGSIDRGLGDEVLGKVSNCWIVEWSLLPDEHILCVVRGSQKPPLKMREYPAASLKGLFQEDVSPDGNLEEHRFIRYAGFGAYNRVAALVQQIGNATYEIPTDYTAPLQV